MNIILTALTTIVLASLLIGTAIMSVLTLADGYKKATPYMLSFAMTVIVIALVTLV